MTVFFLKKNDQDLLYNEGWLRDNYPKMTLQSYISLVNCYDLSIPFFIMAVVFVFFPGVMATPNS